MERAQLLVTTINAMLQRVLTPFRIRAAPRLLEPGLEFARERQTRRLQRPGYPRPPPLVRSGAYPVPRPTLAVHPAGPAGPLGDRPVFAAGDISFPVFLDNYVLRAGLVVPLSDYLLRTVQQLRSAEQSRPAAAIAARMSKGQAADEGRMA